MDEKKLRKTLSQVDMAHLYKILESIARRGEGIQTLEGDIGLKSAGQAIIAAAETAMVILEEE